MAKTRKQRGGTCPCSLKMAGGARSTTYKNRNLLAKLRAGRSIGFTATAHLKAKGLIPRTSKNVRGKKVLGPKYR